MALVYELCPRMVILDGGQIAADGPTSALMADRDRLEAHGLEQPLIVNLAQLDLMPKIIP